jgi:DNA-binding GntR family transcriptional regulator
MNQITEGTGEATYRALRRDIITACLPPGSKLKLDNLRAVYDAGLGTLREALSRLAADGFVIAEGQRGFAVAPVSEAGLREVVDLRLLLEGHGLTRSLAAGDVDWEAQVIAAHHRLDRMEQKLEQGTHDSFDDWHRADRDFHQALIAACGSRILIQSHAEVFDKHLRYRMIAPEHSATASRAQHQNLLTAALARNSAGAIDILHAHLETTAALTEAIKRVFQRS